MNLSRSQSVALWAAALVSALAHVVWADDSDHGRISYSTDEALVLGLEDDEWSFAGINTLVLEGDRVWADDSGAIELELPSGYYIRLADGAETEIVTMPPDGVVRGRVGSFYVQRLRDSRGDLTFDTGAARFTFDPSTVARLDVLTDGATTLSVVDGRVGVFTEHGQVMDVGRGYRTYIDPGLLPSPPETYRSDSDTFDVWNGTRVSYLLDYEQPEPIRRTRSAAPIGTRDLNNYGDWVYVNNVHYWRPVYVKKYVPYRHGYWSHVPRQGYVWVGYYPFDYVTSHYGYWHYDRYYGWLWSYEPVYAPARVVSIYYGDVLFWAPATRYGYPVSGSYVDFRLGGFGFSLAFSSWTYKHHVYGYKYYKPYYCKPLHRHVIYNQPGHTRPYIWNHHHRRDLDYWSAVHRNTNIGDWRDEPTRRVRGFSQSDRRGDARQVAADLQDRRGRAEFRPEDRRAATGDRRTSTEPAQRLARARDIDTIQERESRVLRMQDSRDQATDRRTTQRTPSIDRGTERVVRVDRVPTNRDRVAPRESVTGPDRAERVRDRSGDTMRVLSPDRGLDRRELSGADRRGSAGAERERDQVITRPRDASERVNRASEERTISPIRTLPDRGSARSANPERQSLNRDESRTRVSTDRSNREADRSGRTLDPNRGIERPDRSDYGNRTQIDRVDRAERTRSTEVFRTPPRSGTARPDQSQAPRRPTTRADAPPSRTEYRSREMAPAPSREPASRREYVAPAPSREPAPRREYVSPAPTREPVPRRDYSVPAPTRESVAPSMRAPAPSGPSGPIAAPRSSVSRGGSFGSSPSTRGYSGRTTIRNR